MRRDRAKAPPSVNRPSWPLMPLAEMETTSTPAKQAVRDIPIARVARNGPPAFGAGPIARGVTLRTAAKTGAVTTVKDEHERHHAGVAHGRRDLGENFDGLLELGHRKVRKPIAQPARRKGSGLRRIGGDHGQRRFRNCISAGTKPTSQINPVAIQVMNEVGIDISNRNPKDITEDMMRNSKK